MNDLLTRIQAAKRALNTAKNAERLAEEEYVRCHTRARTRMEELDRLIAASVESPPFDNPPEHIAFSFCCRCGVRGGDDVPLPREATQDEDLICCANVLLNIREAIGVTTDYDAAKKMRICRKCHREVWKALEQMKR